VSEHESRSAGHRCGDGRKAVTTGYLGSCRAGEPPASRQECTANEARRLRPRIDDVPDVKINPAALQWAMREARVGAAEVAERIGVEASLVESWAEGSVSPTVTPFRKLASVLRRPKSFFFASAVPAEGIPPAFRNPAGETKARELTAVETEAIRKARRIQKIASWSALRSGHEAIELPLATRPAPSAAAAREFLNWSVQDQFGAKDANDVRRQLRLRLEERNIVVLHYQLGEGGYRGFSLPDAHAPVIAVSIYHPPAARSFSYLHELGHLMQGQEAVCTETNNTIEGWCNNFAAAFLLPKTELLAEVDRRYGNDALVSDFDAVASIAVRFRVSRDAVAIRLERLRRGAPGLYAAIRASAPKKQRVDPNASFFSPPRHVDRAREVGTAYPRLLLEAESAGALRRHDVLGYLRVNDAQLGSLLAELQLGALPERRGRRPSDG
jgi:Zn-dependent peptidase ImmA (M78 family)